MPFWLKIRAGFVLGPAMPRISRTTPAVWHPGSRRWHRANRGVDPTTISPEVRRADLGARSAFVLATHCRCCGAYTASWCEGCYFRQPDTFGAVCAECDHLYLVCDQCRFRNVTWQQGHAAYIEQGGRDSEDQIEITGWGDRTNPHFEDATGQISVAEVAQVLGVSTQQARDLIREHLSRATQASSSGPAATDQP